MRAEAALGTVSEADWELAATRGAGATGAGAGTRGVDTRAGAGSLWAGVWTLMLVG